MKLGQLGVNQLTILRRGLKRGYVTLDDGYSVYNLPSSTRSSNIRSRQIVLMIMERLETYGLLIRLPTKMPVKWCLTSLGKQVLNEKLPRSVNINRGVN